MFPISFFAFSFSHSLPDETSLLLFSSSLTAFVFCVSFAFVLFVSWRLSSCLFPLLPLLFFSSLLWLTCLFCFSFFQTLLAETEWQMASSAAELANIKDVVTDLEAADLEVGLTWEEVERRRGEQRCWLIVFFCCVYQRNSCVLLVFAWTICLPLSFFRAARYGSNEVGESI